MNWSLVSPQMYGFLLFLILALCALGVTALGVLWTLYQFSTRRSADLDNKIKAAAKAEMAGFEAKLTSIAQSTESQHRETMTVLTEMEKRLPKAECVTDQGSKIAVLEGRAAYLDAQSDVLFTRVRRLEIAFARSSGIEFDEETTLASHEPHPPHSRPR